MNKSNYNTDFQKRNIKSSLRFETISEDGTHRLLFPRVGGYSVVAENGEILRFDLCDTHPEYEKTDAGILYKVHQNFLDIDCLGESWVENGFIEEFMSDEQVESVIFEIIKNADEIHELYIEMCDEEMQKQNCRISIREFKLVDSISGEEIDMLRDKSLTEGCLSENVSITL